MRREITLFLVFMSIALASVAQIQLNLPDHDDKLYHFGINLGYNRSNFLFTHDPRFLQYDSIMAVESMNNAGVNLAFLVNLRLHRHWDLRVHPLDLTFSERAVLYDQKYSPDTSVTKKVQSVMMSIPVNLAFSSDRIDNFKVYTFIGARFDYDLASNEKARETEELLKLKRKNISGEIGMGFHIYFPFFVLSPEIKISQGVINLHSRDPDLKYSNVISTAYSRMVTFSITVE